MHSAFRRTCFRQPSRLARPLKATWRSPSLAPRPDRGASAPPPIPPLLVSESKSARGRTSGPGPQPAQYPADGGRQLDGSVEGPWLRSSSPADIRRARTFMSTLKQCAGLTRNALVKPPPARQAECGPPDRLGAGVTRAVFRVRHRLRPPAVAGTDGAAAGWRGRWRSLRGPDFPQGSICKKRQAMMDVSAKPCGTGQKSRINCACDVRLRQRGLFPGPPEWSSCAPGSASAACLPGPGQRGDALSSATGVRVGWTRIRAGLGVRRTGLASADRATLPGRTRAAGPSGTSAFRCSVRAPGPDSAPRRL